MFQQKPQSTSAGPQRSFVLSITWRRALRAFVLPLCILVLGGCNSIPTDRWIQLSEGLQGVRVMGLAVHPSDVKRITMLTPTRAWLTSDGGAQWDSVALPAPAGQGSLWLRGHGRNEVLLAVLGGRVFESPNFGWDWKSISGVCPSCTSVTARGTPNRCFDAIAGVTVDPTDPNTIYAGTIVGSSDGGVLVSNNNGDAWDWLAGNSTRRCQANSPVSTYRPSSIEIRPSTVCQPSNTFDNDGWPFAVDPHEPSIMLAGGPHPGTDGGGLRI